VRSRRPVVLILGPTACGKSDAAAKIARTVGGEVVSGDAFAVYRGLDVGTAKPSARQRSEVPHHLIDVAGPREPFSAGRWAREARRAIEGIEARGRVPVVAGGSHFYVRALLGHLPGGEIFEARLRRHLASGTTAPEAARRRRMLDLLDPEYASTVGTGDAYRVNRALEVIFSTGKRVSARPPADRSWAEARRWLKISLQISREALYTRIRERIEQMWQAGWPAEVERLLSEGVPVSANSFRAIGYREIASHLAGEMSRIDTIERIDRKTRALVKRQRTWLARERGLAEADARSALVLAREFCREDADDE
jgi:tRNA dimethylallyltransferase